MESFQYDAFFKFLFHFLENKSSKKRVVETIAKMVINIQL